MTSAAAFVMQSRAVQLVEAVERKAPGHLLLYYCSGCSNFFILFSRLKRELCSCYYVAQEILKVSDQYLG